MASDVWGNNMRCIIFIISLCFLLKYVITLEIDEAEVEDEVALMTVSEAWQDILYFELTEPEEVAYVYKIKPAKDFGTQLNVTLVEVELVPTTPADACTTITNSMFVRGAIALVERGDCSFVTKAINAEFAGAVAVVITDNDIRNDEVLIDMTDDGTHRPTHLPAFFLLGKDGFMIRQSLSRQSLHNALINIPINVTAAHVLPRPLPPWSVW